MSTSVCPSWLQIQHVGRVAVVTFTTSNLFLEEDIWAAGHLLARLVEQGDRWLVLNLGSVEQLNSLMFARLISLYHKVKGQGGQLVLCNITPRLREMFDALSLHELIPIYEDQRRALESFGNGSKVNAAAQS